MDMNVEFDPFKDHANWIKHGLSLAEAQSFEWETAVIHEDTRNEYPERRFQATGYIGRRLHVMIYCLRSDLLRVISLRKANPREMERYAKT